MLHGHGDDSYRYSRTITADFSTNVWYGGEPKGLKEYLFSQWATINRYPEVLAESLANQVAEHHRVTPEQVLINSGTTESIYLIAQAFAGQTTTIVAPAFAEYEDACRMFQHRLTFLDWNTLSDLPALTSDLVFICTPNNPTGAIFGQLTDWMGKNPQTLFVIDEAFIEFTRELDTAIGLLDQFDNLLVMRSLTKAYAIPGLRLGYVASKPERIDQLKACKQPWTVNAMALAAGRFIFEQFEQCQLPLDQLLADKAHFVQQLRQNDQLQVFDSDTHFFLAETNKGTAAQLKAFLLEKYGLLIRDASNFRGLGAGHFRVCTLSPDKNALLINALSEWEN
ncbi:aminotransferase class I/II-fold pyridoxal phosphate-dependent enzyme [Spirosoma sp. RP8]|uniref:Aminotransferase n=1 Tax=Spirosoma liriopis TaxID=2937440 RepID=A0ABT0HSG2_9BACT|nr:aminotransferase class I/II-fold pyridoxal phosphate-dependent enzyme [Spirosoma liriopis]MCK8495123.1 aminotransferase class I/II-fold pyridoxal phosphate-dependent enzyme [Spirosoma liriopis]